MGQVGEGNKEFELILSDARLHRAMLANARYIAVVSLLISLFTATLVYGAIDRIMIRPIKAMTRSMLTFSSEPDNPSGVIVPEARADEIGVAERELSAMQMRLQRMLNEQKHLADLGLAVSKINHDMRNILASAQLMSDRLRDGQGSDRAGVRAETAARRSTAPSPIPRTCCPMAAPRNRRRHAGACGCGSWSMTCTACSAIDAGNR